MLELPELEVSKDRLRLALVGKRVVAVELHKPATLEKTGVATEKLVTSRDRLQDLWRCSSHCLGSAATSTSSISVS